MQGQTEGQGQTRRGAVVLGWVEGQLERIGAVLDPEDRQPYEAAVASARAQLGEEAFQKARQEGRAMSMEAAIDYATGTRMVELGPYVAKSDV
jgi:hypothetical protein